MSKNGGYLKRAILIGNLIMSNKPVGIAGFQTNPTIYDILYVKLCIDLYQISTFLAVERSYVTLTTQSFFNLKEAWLGKAGQKVTPETGFLRLHPASSGFMWVHVASCGFTGSTELSELCL